MRLIKKFEAFIRERNAVPEEQELTMTPVITDMMDFLEQELEVMESRHERRLRDLDVEIADLKRAAKPVPYPHPATINPTGNQSAS